MSFTEFCFSCKRRINRGLLFAIAITGLALLVSDSVTAFPRNSIESFERIVRGHDDLSDLFGVLFFPCIFIFVFTKRVWLKVLAGAIWFLDMIVSPSYFIFHIVATIPIVLLALLLRWILNKVST